MTRRPVDWDAVELAMARAKSGAPRAGDLDLCREAFDAEPAEYARRKREVDRAVIDEERKRWR